jgi:hypothetical protein
MAVPLGFRGGELARGPEFLTGHLRASSQRSQLGPDHVGIHAAGSDVNTESIVGSRHDVVAAHRMQRGSDDVESRETHSFRRASIGCDPVHFPGLAAVIGEGLLEVTRIRSDIGDDEADQDGAAVECFLVDEFAPSILELADCRNAQNAAAAAGDIQAPLM